MSNWLAKTTDAAKATLGIIKAVGPFLISQSDKMSEAYKRHLERLAVVEAGKELLQAECNSYIEVRAQLLKRLMKANPEERIQIKSNLSEIEASLRQLKITGIALN